MGRSLPRALICTLPSLAQAGRFTKGRVWFLGLMLWFGSMNSIRGDNFYHECIVKADSSPSMYLSFFYFFQSSCTSDFSGVTYWRNVGQGTSEGIFVIGNGKTLVPYSEGDSSELGLVKGHGKAQKWVTFWFTVTLTTSQPRLKFYKILDLFHRLCQLQSCPVLMAVMVTSGQLPYLVTLMSQRAHSQVLSFELNCWIERNLDTEREEWFSLVHQINQLI